MFRILLYIVFVAVLGLGFALIANHPGHLVLMLGQMRVSVSILAAASIVVITIIAIMILWWLVRSIFLAPLNVAKKYSQNRKNSGHEALSEGILAVLSGDGQTAQRMNKRVGKYLNPDDEPLVKFLEAQTFLLENDTVNALRIYETMIKSDKTKLVGLYGLFQQAYKTGAYEAAHQYAEQATFLAPGLKWANDAVLDRLAFDGHWDKAIKLFERAQNALPRSERASEKLNHLRCVLMCGQALDLAENHLYEAQQLALKAQKLQPNFVPATVIAASFLYKMNETRKANKLIETAWKNTPHPDLGSAYLSVEERAVERFKKAKNLSKINSNHYESYMIVAKAAYDAAELAFARKQAEIALKISPRESAYLLLADIEEAATGQQGRVRQWLSLAVRAEHDPVWIADGTIFKEWAAVSPISGRLDVFDWKVPTRQLNPVLEQDEIHLKNLLVASQTSPDQTEKPIISDNHLAENHVKENVTKIIDNDVQITVDDPGVDDNLVQKPAKKSPFKIF